MIGRVAQFVVAAVLVPGMALAQASARPFRSRHQADAPALVQLVLAPIGNQARFIMREQLERTSTTIPDRSVP